MAALLRRNTFVVVPLIDLGRDCGCSNSGTSSGPDVVPDVAPLPERLHRALVVVPSHERHSVNRRNAVQRGDTGEGGAGSSAAALARDLDSLGLGLGARPPGAHPARHVGPWVAESPATGPTVHPTEPAAGSCPASRWRSPGGGRRAPVDKAHEPASAVRTAIARPLEGSLTVTTRLAALLPELSTSVCGRTEPLPAERPSKTIDSWDARVRPDLLAAAVRRCGAVCAGLAAGGVGCLTAASRRRARWLAVLGVAMFAQAGLHLHTTVRGKLRVWERELDRLNLRGDERLMDLGCGRGAVLIAAARLLPVGLSLIHISEPTRLLSISYAVFCLKK